MNDYSLQLSGTVCLLFCLQGKSDGLSVGAAAPSQAVPQREPSVSGTQETQTQQTSQPGKL